MNPAAIKRFAVIVPAYNASETIVDCLQAILSSTRKPSEVIVYHDGLTDNISQNRTHAQCARHYQPRRACWTSAGPKCRLPRVDLRCSDICRRRCHCC